MEKIPCLFVRVFDRPGRFTLTADPTPGCAWVLEGAGVATRKRDGTACLVRGGRLFRRFDCRKGKAPPEGFEPCGEPDAVTGHWPGWLPVGDEPESRWHREAPLPAEDGTFELCGPKINGNPEGLAEHVMFRHGGEVVEAPRTFEGLRTFLEASAMEGIVFHREDGAMCKIRRSDFGFPWGTHPKRR